MRGWRAPLLLVAYLAILSIVVWLVYLATRSFGGSSGATPSQAGKIIFSFLVVFQTIMVALLTPAFTAASITSEREQRTYDLLMTTLLPPRSVILGKLGSALAYVVILILAVAPLESLAFMFGGVSPEEIILSQVTMLMAALFFASVGIFWSSFLRSSVASNVLAYGTILVQLIGLPFIYGTITAAMGLFVFSSGNSASYEPAFTYITLGVLSSNPLIAMGMSEAFYMGGDPLFIYTSTTKVNGHTMLIISPWLLFCIESLVVSAILVLLSIRLVRPVGYKHTMPQSGYNAVGTGAPPMPVAEAAGAPTVPVGERVEQETPTPPARMPGLPGD